MQTEEEAPESWREQCRRQMDRPVSSRLKYGFAWVDKLVLDDPTSPAFDSMADYRRWCHQALPPYLGYRLDPLLHAST